MSGNGSCVLCFSLLNANYRVPLRCSEVDGFDLKDVLADFFLFELSDLGLYMCVFPEGNCFSVDVLILFYWSMQRKFQEMEEVAQAKSEELGEKAEEFAKDHRVPVPQMNLPFVGPVRSLVLKQVRPDTDRIGTVIFIEPLSSSLSEFYESSLAFDVSNN